MCSRYKVCGKKHSPRWRTSKKRRNRKGQFVESPRTLTAVFLGVVIVITGATIGWNQIFNSIGMALQVENSQAVEVITEEDIEEARIQRLIDRIYQVARVYGVSGYQMERTIECESRFNNVQSSAYQNGVREDSWGLSQIHLPSHPSVSREEALNEEFAIEWMAKNFNNPYVTWYAYNKKLDKCNYD